mmetsp:Transcript_62152/g.124531  ORF Transcript_62152/g.124531 Transcript_62152/m.124531 type:complete len:202 (+) Transcript_62152:317-922(+)
MVPRHIVEATPVGHASHASRGSGRGQYFTQPSTAFIHTSPLSAKVLHGRHQRVEDEPSEDLLGDLVWVDCQGCALPCLLDGSKLQQVPECHGLPAASGWDHLVQRGQERADALALPPLLHVQLGCFDILLRVDRRVHNPWPVLRILGRLALRGRSAVRGAASAVVELAAAGRAGHVEQVRNDRHRGRRCLRPELAGASRLR